ncbi:39S ribosomal protein L36, mitochondrial [Drosophila grimshawi]|uniref:Ribosomal protein n=1 Tax=Drosophila grimshawi TaxID=7222 RepID=B4IWR5_DROGR|nr:39S ribosomal protein L36, mitochondrial [Drosophila grimshawi]EDV96291.1 GH15288 [Drosophila grimshawi]
MSLANKFLQSSARLWNSISATRGFHMLMRPTTVATTTPAHSTIGQQLVTTTNITGSLLAPFNALVQQVAGFKVKGRLKRRCKDCYIVVRQERGYVICPTHPRHKQMSMKKRDYKSWILTHATQSKERGF